MRRLRITVLSIIVIATGGLSLLIYRNFYPRDRYEIASMGSNRIFAVAPESSDETILVKTADWPHTFFKPIVLGDAVSSGKFQSTKIRWSKEADVAALFAMQWGKTEGRYLSAYDFGEHTAIGAGSGNLEGDSFHETIAKIMNEKGIGKLIDIPSLNSGFYRK